MALRYDEKTCRAWLASIQLPSAILERLLRDFDGQASSVYETFFAHDGQLRDSLPAEMRTRMIRNGGIARMDAWKAQMEQEGIQALTFLDDLWPESLEPIQEPPRLLFLRGNPDCLSREKKLAMFGARRATYRGQQAAERLARELSDSGVTIVSGLADGIDTRAHQGCLKGKSPTIAVLGCGLDQVYPAGNWKLRNEILEKGGLLISEYCPGEKPLSWHFPVRNRIISGLCPGVVLIEARLRSGSMRTVAHAADQGREVFVYPGDPESPAFEANHQLIREGARFFTRAEDLLEDMNWLDNPAEVSQNSGCEQEDKLPREQEAVVRALQPGALGFDQLSAATGLSAQELMSALTLLQIQGRVEALPGKSYQLKTRT